MKENIETILPKIRIHTVVDEFLIASCGYDIFMSNDMGKTWIFSGTCARIITEKKSYRK